MAQRQMEELTRGLVAVKHEEGVFVSWRVLATDPKETAFNVYRQIEDGEPVLVNKEPITGGTNLIDAESITSKDFAYILRPVLNGKELEGSRSVTVWSMPYLEIPIQPISNYRLGDASVADLDGDGEYEIVLHQTSGARDNSHPGITGTPILDAYEMDGTHLWRIDLGVNIREGEHYTQFMVYDLDGDGRAEMACKTADGTTDALGKVIEIRAKTGASRKKGTVRMAAFWKAPSISLSSMARPAQR